MSSKLITDIINGSNGDINADFFINANLTEVMDLLEENEGNLDTMKWVGKSFPLLRFHLHIKLCPCHHNTTVGQPPVLQKIYGSGSESGQDLTRW